MPASIKDVAKEAGVSIATVSRVINEVDVVNDITKARVMKAIEKLDYRPNIVARSLKTQKTSTIGIIIPDISSQFYSEIVRGAEDASNIYNYNVILCNTDLDKNREMEYIRILKEKMVDGVIYMSNSLEPEIIELLRNLKIPTVLVETRDMNHTFPSVTIDNKKAAFDAVSYLINKKNKKIAFLGRGSEYKNASADRFIGYKDALAENSMEYDESIVRFISSKSKEGYEAMKELCLKEKFDAVFCGSDEIAMGAINALRENNISVPGDIDVIGFDNIYMSSIFYPKLTTVEQPMYDMGSVGMRMLIKMLTNNKLEAEHIVLQHFIVERESCK